MIQPVPVNVVCDVLEIPLADAKDLATLKPLAKAARKRLARIHHPDRGGDPKRMQAINRMADAVRRGDVAFLPQMQHLPPQARVMAEAMRQWAQAHGFGFRVDARGFGNTSPTVHDVLEQMRAQQQRAESRTAHMEQMRLVEEARRRKAGGQS